MDKKEELKKEIAKKKLELEQLENQEKNIIRNKAIRPLSEFSDADKIAKFDELYKSAESFIKKTEDNQYEDEDDAQYAHEKFLGIVARNHKAFWEYYRSIQ